MTKREKVIRDRLCYWHDEVYNKHGEMLEAKERFLMEIERARDDGWTYQQIADALCLSTSRIQQLVRQSEGRGRSNR